MNNLMQNGSEFYFLSCELDNNLPVQKIKKAWFNLQIVLVDSHWHLIDWVNKEVLMEDLPVKDWQSATSLLNDLRDYLS